MDTVIKAEVGFFVLFFEVTADFGNTQSICKNGCISSFRFQESFNLHSIQIYLVSLQCKIYQYFRRHF